MILKKNIQPFGLDMWLAPGRGGLSPALYYWDEGRELAFMHLIDKTVREGMVCIDLGANIGYTTLAMLKNVGKSGFVYAIEPDPRNIDLLRKNIEHNKFEDICEIHECAISDKDGKGDFLLAENPNLSVLEKSELYGKEPVGKIEVKVVTLKTFLKNRRYPNFIKMDVQGHEVKILEPAWDYFRERRGETYILAECHPYVGNPRCLDPDRDFGRVLRKYFEIGFNAQYAITGSQAANDWFPKYGYKPIKVVETDGYIRGIYTGLRNEHLIEMSCKQPQKFRSIMIGRSE